MSGRDIRRLSSGIGVAALLIGLQLLRLAPVGAQPGTVTVSTDRSQYQVGDAISVCYSVAGPGPFTITDTQANGKSHTFFSGVDDGSGGCLAGSVTPPTGSECLSITALGGSGGSAQTCFQVLGQAPPSSQQCGTVSTLNDHVTSSGAQQVENCFSQAYQQCSPATLEYDDHGIDNGTHYTFSLQSNGSACAITEDVRGYSAVLPFPPGPPELGTCAGLSGTQFGLLFTSCEGGENVLVPAG